jgi:hypothetical protein
MFAKTTGEGRIQEDFFRLRSLCINAPAPSADDLRCALHHSVREMIGPKHMLAQIEQRRNACGQRVAELTARPGIRAAMHKAVEEWREGQHWGHGIATADQFSIADGESDATLKGDSLRALPFPAHSSDVDEIHRNPDNNPEEKLVMRPHTAHPQP